MNARETLAYEPGQTIFVKTKGAARITGWDEPQVAVLASDAPEGERLSTVQHTEAGIVVDAPGDCTVHVPAQAPVHATVQGDLAAQGVVGPLHVERCRGDASLAQVGAVHIEEVKGDLQVQDGAGLTAKDIRGDAQASHLTGSVKLSAQGDVHLEDVAGDVAVNSGGSVHLADMHGRVRVNGGGDVAAVRCEGDVAIHSGGDIRLEISGVHTVQAVAKGDVDCTLDAGTNVRAKIVAGGGLRIESETSSLERAAGVFRLEIGSAAADLKLVAGGDVTLRGVTAEAAQLRGVSAEPGAGASWAGFGAEFGGLGAELGALGAEIGLEFGGLGRELAQEFGRKFQAKFKKALRSQLRKAGVRMARGDWADSKTWNFSFGEGANPPGAWDIEFEEEEELSEEAAHEPVGEEERMMILRMLEAGTINAEQAEKLLEAMGEG